MVTTLKSGAVYSPVDDWARKIGRNAAAVVSDATSSGERSSRAAWTAASIGRRPTRICMVIASVITMALSTSIPSARISPASETWWMPMPKTGHQEQRREDRDRHEARDHEPRPQPHEQQQHADDDADRLDQAAEEGPQPRADDLRLEPHDVELDADRIPGPEPRNLAPDAGAEGDDVAPGAHRDRERERRGSRGVDQLGGRLGVPARDRREVLEGDECGTPRQGDDRTPEVVDRLEAAGRLQRDSLHRGANFPPGNQDVDALEDRTELERREARLGQPLVLVVDEDPLVLRAVDVDLGDVIEPQQVVAHRVGNLLEIGVRVAVSGQRDDDPEDVAQLVVDERPDRAVRQIRGDPRDLAAQVVPDGLHVARVVAGPHRDERHAGPRPRRDVLDLGDLLQRGLDHVGDQVFDAGRARPRQTGQHHRPAKGDLGILGPRQLQVGAPAGGDQEQENHRGDAVLLNRCACQVHALRFSRGSSTQRRAAPSHRPRSD